MGRIRRLPDALANQIAAGEVVERPASIVKELAENSLDAGATRITVTVEYGGKKLIRVEDDGIGMEPGDARLCLERHATSKIQRADDLESIATLGFRGEALPSIASVSHFRLRTRAKGSPSGTEIRVNGGAVESVVEAGGPEGTLIEVADVFYNLPARRKFLKSDSAESAQVSKVVTQLALSHPEVGFTLTSAGRTMLRCPPVANLPDRLYQLYGDRPDLVPVHRETSGITLTGFIAALVEQGARRGPQNVFVNRRIVKDKTIAHAIIDAYSVASNRERSPEVHLFIEMPPDRVDVNVHPTKAEVRFRDQSLVHEVVRRAIGDALGREGAPELQLRTSDVLPPPHPLTPSIPGVLAGGVYTSRWTQASGASGAWNASGAWGAYGAPGTQGSGGSTAVVEITGRSGALTRHGVNAPLDDSRPLIPLGQFRDTFIIAIDDEGVAIIDQHVAHERVLFERIMERLNSGTLESQRLLVPLVLDFPPASREALMTRAPELVRFGFEIEEFGGGSVRISAVPALLERQESEQAVRALAEDLEGLDRGLQIQEGLKRIAASMACHAAVKAHYPLTMEKMVHILEELRQTSHSTVCPHGRPVMLRITRRELEKNFERS
jgi:DNA mismatch repair protein MutL